MIFLALLMCSQAFGQVAVLTQKSGSIQVTNGRTGESHEVKPGQPITRFDKIIVPKDGSAQFVFSNGNSLQLNSDATLAIEDYEYDKVTGLDYTLLNLQKGKARFSSPNSYSTDKNSAILKTDKMKLSGKSDFNVVVDASNDKTEAVNLKGEVDVGLETVKRKMTPVDSLKPGFKIRNKTADEIASSGEESALKPFAPAEEVAADQLATTKKEMDVEVDKGPFDTYVKSNPSFGIRYKPSAYQKLRRRIKVNAKK